MNILEYLEYPISIFLCLWKTILITSILTSLLILFIYKNSYFVPTENKIENNIYYNSKNAYFSIPLSHIEKELNYIQRK